MSQETNDIYKFNAIDDGSLLVSGSRSMLSTDGQYHLLIELTFDDPKNRAHGHLALTREQSIELRKRLEEVENELDEMNAHVRTFSAQSTSQKPYSAGHRPTSE